MSRFVLFKICFFFLYSLFAQDWKPELDSVLKILEKDKLFHGQILIAEQGEIVFHKAYGLVLEGDTPITLTTSLAVKSITKAFTAAAILQLEQAGKLKLTDDVKLYFNNWPYVGVRIKDLLSMTSGLPSFIEKAVSVGDTTTFMTNVDIVDLISKHPVSVQSPGSTYNYKNSNYIVLAALVEKVSGMPFEEFMSKTIFEPLELENTYLRNLKTISDTINGNTFYVPSGDGNLYSTAKDLYRFEQSYTRGGMLSKKNIEVTFSKTKLSDGSLSKYGLAWWVIDDENLKEYYIVGDGPNIRASIQRYPETNSTLIYIHNISGRYWSEVYWVVRNIWFGNEYELPEKTIKLTKHTIDKKLYDNYVGSYLSPRFGLLHITKDNNKLYLRPNPIPGKEELIPSSDTTFYFKDKSVEWEFYFDDNGMVIGLGLRGKPNTMGEKQ